VPEDQRPDDGRPDDGRPDDGRPDDDRPGAERLLRRQLDRLWVRQTLRTVLIEQSGGLDPTARVILRAVERLGEVRSTAVAERTGLSRPVVSRRIAGLVEAGYVRTTPDPDDGRAALLALAPAGRRLLDGLDAQGDAVFDDVTSVFDGQELRDLARLLARFNDRAAEVLGAGGEDDPGPTP
jgi:DNA-binding MarR family transcriptional regulator